MPLREQVVVNTIAAKSVCGRPYPSTPALRVPLGQVTTNQSTIEICAIANFHDPKDIFDSVPWSESAIMLCSKYPIGGYSRSLVGTFYNAVI